MNSLFTSCILLAWAATAAIAGNAPNDLDRLAAWMTGSFSSAEQAALDPDYYDIRLEVVRIWEERTDGYWLYIEQATATALDKPYRQRIYHVEQLNNELFESSVYAIKSESLYVGGWKTPAQFDNLSVDSLDLREACSIVLRPYADLGFVGNTVGRLCESSLRGAAYAVSDVEIYADRMISWDRGFDVAGKQVWGAARGGYVFKKIVH